jgi:serine/threonine protein kinase
VILNPGDRIAAWEVIKPLGFGGMGAVYLVRNYRVKETVLALKVLLSDWTENPQVRARFYREGEVMSGFEHQHIVRVFSDGVVHDERRNLFYILMEYVQGKTLDSLLKERKGKGLDLDQVLEFASQVAQALSYAHSQNPPVIHRDIKPSNIMVADPTFDSENSYPLGRAVVMDWGIAKKLIEDGTHLTGGWSMVGTPKYCAPEQMHPYELVSYSADVYSLGLVMYEMYAGKQFFAGLDNDSVVRKVRDDPEEYELRFDRPADPGFIELVRRAITKSQTRRYQRMEEFLQDLKAYRDSIPDLTPPTRVAPAPQGEEDSERQRRRLEEQQRDLTLQLQVQAKSAREKAAQAGAEEWAAATFQQGLAQEEEATRKLGDRHYFPAQEAYEKARRSFDQARGEALALALQKAEQARQDLRAVKAEADRYDARRRAQRFYRDGLSLEDEARGLEEGKQYLQAVEVYARAKTAFADARERAYDALHREVEAEQARAGAEKEAARGDQAEELAAEVFGAGLRSEEQAAAALGREELTQAQRLYLDAYQKYEQL